MDRLTRALGLGLLLTATALLAGCGSSASGLTGSTAEMPKVTNDDPMARPIQVAWTAARAQRCGFYFDPAKLKSAYIAFESRQPGVTTDQLAKIQMTYDSTFKSISERVSADPDYCTDKKGAEIKADLQRHLAADYAPNLPKAKEVKTACGFFGCAPPPDTDEKFDARKMFGELDKKAGRSSGQ